MAKTVPAHLMKDILREVAEFEAFKLDNAFPPETAVKEWLAREAHGATASRNMFGAPWLQSHGFSSEDLQRLQYDLLEEAWHAGLQPLDQAKCLLRAVGQKLNDAGGLKTMQFNFVVLQGMVNGGALLGSGDERPAGVRAFTPFVSNCWSGVGDWVH